MSELSPRNSQFRSKVEKITVPIAEAVHKTLPWLTPDMITLLGTAGVLTAGLRRRYGKTF
jgi:hypothetical protein